MAIRMYLTVLCATFALSVAIHPRFLAPHYYQVLEAALSRTSEHRKIVTEGSEFDKHKSGRHLFGGENAYFFGKHDEIDTSKAASEKTKDHYELFKSTDDLVAQDHIIEDTHSLQTHDATDVNQTASGAHAHDHAQTVAVENESGDEGTPAASKTVDAKSSEVETESVHNVATGQEKDTLTTGTHKEAIKNYNHTKTVHHEIEDHEHETSEEEKQNRKSATYGGASQKHYNQHDHAEAESGKHIKVVEEAGSDATESDHNQLDVIAH